MPVTSDFNHETIVTLDQKTFVLVEVGPDDHIPSQSALGGSPSFRHSPSRIPYGGSPSFRTSPSHIPLDGSTSFRTSPSRSPIGRGPSFRSTNVWTNMHIWKFNRLKKAGQVLTREFFKDPDYNVWIKTECTEIYYREKKQYYFLLNTYFIEMIACSLYICFKLLRINNFTVIM